MGSFGERLRREREMRGVTLDDIAEATKIGTRSLRALEDEHFELLPGGIFNKGFVRAYAKYLGLNEDEMVADYLQAAGESGPDPRLIAEQNSSRIDRGDGDFGDSQRPGFPIVPVLILLVVVAAGIGGWRIYQDRMRERQARLDAAKAAAASQPATSTSPASTPSAGTEPTTASQAGSGLSRQTATPSANPSQPAQPSSAVSTPSNSATSQPIEVVVKPKDKAWVSIKSDGKFVVRGVIGPPAVKTIHGVEQVIFWTGNAGAIDLTFNGQPVAVPGGLNEVAVLVITPKGVTPGKPPSADHAAQ
jgi:cytoskeletal protein RodZ